MCGVPYHSAEQYISKLIAKGYKVAVCEQMEDPKLCKGLVSRDIVRIISPGTIMETSMLREGESNYLGAVMLRGKAGGCAFADVSTGEVCAASFETDAAMHIQNEISRFQPSFSSAFAGLPNKTCTSAGRKNCGLMVTTVLPVLRSTPISSVQALEAMAAR